MLLSSALLFFVAFSLPKTNAASVAGRAVASSASARCEDAVVTETYNIGPVSVTKFACPNGFGPSILMDHLDATSISRATSSATERSALEYRQFDACTTPAPECQSAVLCNDDICNGNIALAPALSDCNVISEALTSTSGTFFVQPQTFVSLTFQTCEFAFGNFATNGQIEYSLFNWGNLGSVLYNNCITVDRAAGGACVSDSGLYFAETVLVGHTF